MSIFSGMAQENGEIIFFSQERTDAYGNYCFRFNLEGELDDYNCSVKMAYE